MTNNPASVLLVGFGYAATTFHLPFLRYLDGAEITGVVSSRPATVAQSLSGTDVFASLDEALSRRHFDLVIITTPNHLHGIQTRQALEAHCHVLVEKPFTLNAGDAQDLCRLAEKQNRMLSVFHNRRFDGDFLTIKKLIADNTLGQIKRFESRFDRFRPVPRDRWRENAGPGSGITWDLAPHLIDQALLLFGMPEALTAHIDTLRSGGQSDDCFTIELHYDDKQVSLGSSPFQANDTVRFDIQGTRGSYRKLGLDPQEAQLKQAMNMDHPAWAVTSQSDDGNFRDESNTHQVKTCAGNYLGFYQQLLRAINNEEEAPATGREAVNVIKLIELASASAQQRRTLSVQ